MKTIYIVHGWEGSPDHGWIARLKKQLTQQGHEVFALSMPNPDRPVIADWVKILAEQVKTGQDTFIVAHSVGVQTVLRRVATLADDVKLGGLISVAGRFSLVGLEDEESERLAHPWIQDDVNWVKSASHFQTITAIFSDDDPFVPVSDSLLFHERLGAEIIVESEKGHIYWQDPEKGYPRLLELVKGQLGVRSEEGGVTKEKTAVTNVVIRVLDRDGSDMGSFPASKHEPLLDTAEKHGIDIGYSCRSGACFSCACHTKQGFEHIDLGKFGYPLVDVDEGDCLTCISGIMDDAWEGEDKEIVIKKF